MEDTNKKLSASEAVFGLLGWLTSRPEVVVFSAGHNAAIAAGLADQFCQANNLEKPSEEWHKKLVHPIEKNPDFVLTDQHLQLLKECGDAKGLEVYGKNEAKLFREIEANRPAMITIQEGSGSLVFWVNLTDEGEKILEHLLK